MKRIRLLLADDHVMVLDALVGLLGQEFEVAGVARDGGALVEMAQRLGPDVIVTDVAMPEVNGIDAARILRTENHPAKILFLTMYSDLPLIEEAFRAGASGYMLKMGGTDELAKAIQCIVHGGTDPVRNTDQSGLGPHPAECGSRVMVRWFFASRLRHAMSGR